MKDFILRQLGKRYKNVEWAKRNKTWIGLVFAIAGVYVTHSCPGLNSDVCKYISDGLLSLGSFLTGAGILPSDYRERFVQGLVKKEE
jgi:hypothetical protein